MIMVLTMFYHGFTVIVFTIFSFLTLFLSGFLSVFWYLNSLILTFFSSFCPLSSSPRHRARFGSGGIFDIRYGYPFVFLVRCSESWIRPSVGNGGTGN